MSIFCTLTLSAESTQSVLARLEKESGAFRQVTAKLTKATHTAILDDTTTESGRIWMRRAGKTVSVRTEIVEPEARAYSFEGDTGQVYYPKMNMVQIYDVGKSRSLVDQFVLLGFGTSGKDLAKNYTVNAVGEEAVAGRKTTRVELIPRSPKVKEQITKVELWIPLDAGHPVQQKFYQPGGDYYLVTYSDVQLNSNLPDNAFRLKLPSDVKREYPQK
ncbi:MAG TPA: outer membrane lipoprotein carrier protein LolA [Bryobacteraceae bacterium]|nr:outer membrane lipoprotein carrier protein LolA [Bryobacteraceae bacterium]